ncbi:phenoloxidase subunit 2-like isoform X2 [Arctopsyche grandis]|uniref:phenoloxidase subunit 2-like isoform X2 n=1 Tax=Arctopsyche grandis TaxID=121162 RepID=UPI00406D91D6
MSDVKKSIQLLFDRPSEPLFMPKGDNNSVFDVPQNFLAPQYETLGVELSNRFGEDANERIPLKDVSVPDLTTILDLPRQAEFTLFIPKHRRIAGDLIDILIRKLNDFLSTAAYCRDRVNTQLFNYCLSVALLHREDTKDIPLPNLMQSFPSKFVDSQVFQQAREVSAVVPENLRRNPIVIPKDFSASDLEEEHRIAYFREDIGINLHHWHWHLIYPFSSANREIVAKDRRGELFYYMHQQILARYNAERLSNSLARVKRFNNFRNPIAEGYYSKLDSLTSGRAWTPRQAGATWQDLNRPSDDIILNIEQIEQWRDRIDAAISSGNIENEAGESVPLDIDTLGNIMESSMLSPNANFYGDFHNSGHLFTAYVHDPDNKYLELFGVMADEATTMRDPFFYRWHAQIDNIFQKFKSSAAVQPYNRAQLTNPNITITSINVNGGAKPNVIQTLWMQSDVDLSRGLDFSNRGPVLVRFTHLNHIPFTYTINVNNAGEAKMGTVRIFIAPKVDERGLPWQLNDHRLMFIEMDRFTTTVQSGENSIVRRSDESSVTIPFERTFRSLSGDPRDETETSAAFNFCGCGWPQHMLVPKGTAKGADYQVFAMISNYDLDVIEQDTAGVPCSDAFSFCGIKDRLYPDRRSMGYPFDRPPNARFTAVEDFLQPNMKLQDIKIRFTDTTVQNPRNTTT